MEESEKRRERLRAMRTEASQSGASSEIGSEFQQLANPLIESSVNPPMQTNPHGASRFDYYTDPMAAFSNDKRMGRGSYQNSPGSFNHFPTPRNPKMTPSPAHRLHLTHSPDPRMYQPRSPYYGSSPMHPETTLSPAHHGQSSYAHDPRMFRPQSPYYQRLRGPYNSQPENSPAHQGQSGNFQARGPYHNPNHHGSPRGPHSAYGVANISTPNFGGTHSSSVADSPNTGSGYRSSPGSGRGRGRSGLGRGGNREFGGSASAELRPDLYYNKSMVEDPWKNLEPSIWKVEEISVKDYDTQGLRKFSHSDTFGTKKARVSEGSKESNSQPSLAEYLAAAFNETVSEKGYDDKSII